MQVTATPTFPAGLIFVEVAQSGRTRTWHAQDLSDAVGKANRTAIQARKGDESDELEAVTTLDDLRAIIGRDLRSLTVYTVADAADLAAENFGREAQYEASALGWVEDLSAAQAFAAAAEEFGTVDHDGAILALTQHAYVDNKGDGVYYYADAIDENGDLYRVEWETTAAWDEREAAYKADPINNAPAEDESEACDWAAPVRIISL